MNKNKILAVCAAILALAACKKDKPVNPLGGVYGEWKLERWYEQPTDGTVPAEVYLSFSKEGTFELFQKLGDSGHFSAYTGTYGLNSAGALYGTYSDGKSWGGTYNFSVDGDRLTLKNSEVTGYGTCVYVRTEIPASVRKDASDYSTEVKSPVSKTL